VLSWGDIDVILFTMLEVYSVTAQQCSIVNVRIYLRLQAFACGHKIFLYFRLLTRSFVFSIYLQHGGMVLCSADWRHCASCICFQKSFCVVLL